MEDFAENEPCDKRPQKRYFYEVSCEIGRYDREEDVDECVSAYTGRMDALTRDAE